MHFVLNVIFEAGAHLVLGHLSEDVLRMMERTVSVRVLIEVKRILPAGEEFLQGHF